MATQVPPQNSSSRSSFMIRDEVAGRHINLTRQMVKRIQDTGTAQISIQGPDGKGRFNAKISDVTNPGQPITLFTTTFIYTTEEMAEQAMRHVLEKVKDLML